MAMAGLTDWRAANDHPKERFEPPTREWMRPRGETWYRRVPQAATPAEASPAPAGPPRHALVTASRVAGSAVYTTGGQRLGRVAEIALDEATGEVAFVVLASGGFLGFGERLARIPWEGLSYDSRRAGYVLDMPESEVRELTASPVRIAFEASADRGGWATRA
jgi:sporulation protein YlmC with PRC-barrel domain